MTDDLTFVADFDDPKLEALVETMFLAAYADEELSPEEEEHFKKSVESLTDGRVAGAQLGELFERFKKELDGSDRAARLASVKERLPELGQRKAALAMAIRMTAADGIIRTSERELILETAEALDIDPNDAADMVKAEERP